MSDIDLTGTAHGQLAVPRRILKMDEFVEMTGIQPQFEKEVRLPVGMQGATATVFLFSINGYLQGLPVTGALLAGECMLVEANTRDMAERIAKEGLEDTRRIAFEEAEQRSVIDLSAAEAGLGVEAAGKNGREASNEPELLGTDPLLKSIIASEIGGLPWKQ